MTQQTEIRFVLSQGWGDFKILWCMKYELGKSYNGYLKDGSIMWDEVQEGQDYSTITPFMRINNRFFPLQEMIDALTGAANLQPTKQVELDAELKATKYHLEDMRKLVFRKEE